MNFRISSVFLCLFALVGCQCASQTGSVVKISGNKSRVSYEVEVVRSQADRMRGLMYRDSLAQNKGMLFVFDSEGHYPFWMENTKIPLDIVFFDNNWTVVGTLENMEPMSRAARAIEKPSRYALEINAGLVQKEGIGPGDVGTFTEEKK